MSTQLASASRRGLLKNTLAATLSTAVAGSLAPLHALAPWLTAKAHAAPAISFGARPVAATWRMPRMAR